MGRTVGSSTDEEKKSPVAYRGQMNPIINAPTQVANSNQSILDKLGDLKTTQSEQNAASSACAKRYIQAIALLMAVAFVVCIIINVSVSSKTEHEDDDTCKGDTVRTVSAYVFCNGKRCCEQSVRNTLNWSASLCVVFLVGTFVFIMVSVYENRASKTYAQSAVANDLSVHSVQRMDELGIGLD